MIAVCLNYAWKKKSRFLKKSCIFTIWLIWPRPNTKLLPWGHEIYHCGRPFLGHNYYILSLFESSPGVKKFCKEIHQFFKFYLKIMPSPWDGGLWILQFLVSLPYKCNIPNLVKIGPVVLEKMLIHDSQQTPTHSNSPSQSELLILAVYMQH